VGQTTSRTLTLSLIALVGCGSTNLKNPDAGSGGTTGSNSGGATGTGSGGATEMDAAVDALPACTGTCVVPFASSSDWAAYDDDPVTNPAAQRLGNAQPVCLNATSPPNCPPGAFLYSFGAGWGLSLAATPGALWVWGPDITLTAPADLKRFVFVNTFVVGASPAGSISVAVDDFAEIHVNGRVVGHTGSVTDVNAASQANSSLAAFDLAPYLVPGSNTIAVVGQNGPSSFAGCPSACTYNMNPAGVVFGGALTYH
jgi:hypothetical protein